MSQDPTSSGEASERLGFLDSLTRIFRGQKETGEPEPVAETGDARLEALGTSFDTAIGEFREKIEEQRVEPGVVRAVRRSAKPEDREKAREKRMADIRLRIRGDIEQMHTQLGTGLKGVDLDEVIGVLEELEQFVSRGRSSHELVPRVRHAIAERLRTEAGELAVERLRALLERAAMSWPDPTHYSPSATDEAIERSLRRRLAETREAFLGQGFSRTAQTAVGIVTTWGADYPDPGSPLWNECVLEGVAAGMRGQLAQAFLEVLRQDRELLIAAIEDMIGKEVAELHRVVDDGVTSIHDASRVMASALQVVDIVVPEVAWKHVCGEEPRARGEWKD
jgi:hypothetical protein